MWSAAVAVVTGALRVKSTAFHFDVYTVDSRYLELAYLEVKIWFLPKHKNLTTGKNYCGKEEKLLLRSLFYTIFSIYL